MQVTTEALREAFCKKPSEELRRIVESDEGQYTPEAIIVAREILEGRPVEAEEAVIETPKPISGRRDTWSDVGPMLGAGYALKQAFYFWRAAEANPEAAKRNLQLVATNPWTYACIAAFAVWSWRKRRAA